jgi:peptidoglycan hydrolase-like protein with peptidoglycan-binding domain
VTRPQVTGEPDAPISPAATPGRTRRRRRWMIPAIAVVLAAAAGAGWYATRTASGGGQPSASGLPPATATVTRQDLAETQQEDGTLGYGDEYQMASGVQGTVTWLPAAGRTIRRGKPVYKVDNRPVLLLYGVLPLYRPLSAGVADGPDVYELETNLRELGYGGFTVDDHYTSATADAVAAWQDDRGLPDTGTVQPGAVFVSPGAIRVGEQKAATGDRIAPNQPVLGYTGTTRTVTVDLDVADQQLAVKGGKVTVDLPDGTQTRGTVASIGTVVQAPPSSSTGGSTGSDTITVQVTLDDPGAAGNLDQAPVEVNFVSDEVHDVLTVPVAALLALAEGGYGVQLVEGGTTRVVAVKVGVFADTRVQVSGGGLHAGMKVGVPAS